MRTVHKMLLQMEKEAPILQIHKCPTRSPGPQLQQK